eukprot:gene16670-11929_t
MIQRHISGSSINTGMEYNEVCPGDEVEDLYELLKDVQAKYPTVKAVACGAILSNYQRHRLEHVCGRLGLTVLSYLWQKERKELLEEMILEHNMDIMLVKVAGAGLQPRKHLGKRLKDLYPQLLKLHKKYGLDLCGEGGEYESLVLDAPYFRKRIEIVATKIIEDPEDPDVGNLFVLDHRVVDKEIPNATVAEAEAATPAYPRFESAHQQLNKALALSSSSSSSSSSAVPSSVDNLHQPRTSLLLARKPVKIHWKEDGFGHTELITAMGTAAGGEAESSLSAVYRAQLTEVMNRLVHTLTVIHGLRQEDIAFVHLYLQDMTMFAVANEVYYAIQQHATEGNAAEDEEGEEYAEDFDAYDIDQDDQEEAEERHRKAQASAHAVLPPIVFVGVPGLPRNASCEIEVIAAKTDRVRATGWKQVHVTEREPITTTAADGRGATVVVNANNDVDSWPIWSSDASSVSASRRVGGEDEADATVPLVGQALVKTYPGTVCSGVVDVLVPCASTASENTVDVARMLAVGVSTLQRTLREDAAMRPNRLLYVKVLYDPAVVGSLVTPDMVCHWWKDAWLDCAAVAASSSASSSAATSLLPVASTMALPVSFLQPSTTTTTPHTVALHVLFFAADAHQLETESWIKLASNHCQGS